MELPTVDALDGPQRVLLRADLNAPVEDGAVQDCKRFERHADTIQQLLDDGHAVAVLAHQGRPGRDTYVPLEQHADRLEDRLDRPVSYVDDVHGDTAQAAADALTPGEVLVLENTRFVDHELECLPPEQHAEHGLVQDLHGYFDCYVNDAFSAAHRPHASLVGFPAVMDAYAGPVMTAEYTNTARIREQADGETVMVLGGKKPEDVLHVMDALMDTVDTFLVGGLIGELFLRADGHDVGYDVGGDTFMHEQWLEHRDRLKQLLADHRGKIHLPLDLAYRDDGGERSEVMVSDAAKTHPYWDIGRTTAERFTEHIRDADTVFVKGAAGVFEEERFSTGTRRLLQAIGDHDGFSVVGGGDTSRCIDLYDDLSEDDYDHVSIAGGAYIRALTGEDLPAIEALRQ